MFVYDCQHLVRQKTISSSYIEIEYHFQTADDRIDLLPFVAIESEAGRLTRESHEARFFPTILIQIKMTGF